MQNGRTTIQTRIELALMPGEAFDILCDELVRTLGESALIFETGPSGRVIQSGYEVGHVLSWKPGEHILLRWQQAEWSPEEVMEVELRLEATAGGTRITLEQRGWGGLIGDPGEMAGWFAGEVVAPILRATAPQRLGDWLTDRAARHPSGAQARSVYREPLYHYPLFSVALEHLGLTDADYLVEVGCGGGAFLKNALKSGCRAAAVDHSSEMVWVAGQENTEAVAEGRLTVQQASATHLPFADATFTCATMLNVFGFLPDPIRALSELRRVLKREGRIVVLGSDPAMRGTMAAPEPMASRLRFYDDDAFAHLARQAGFESVNVVRRDLEPFARQVGIPEEHLALFSGPGAPFLLARKS